MPAISINRLKQIIKEELAAETSQETESESARKVAELDFEQKLISALKNVYTAIEKLENLGSEKLNSSAELQRLKDTANAIKAKPLSYMDSSPNPALSPTANVEMMNPVNVKKQKTDGMMKPQPKVVKPVPVVKQSKK